MNKILLISLVCLSGIFMGCNMAVKFEKLDPHPNIVSVGNENVSLALDFGESVSNEQKVGRITFSDWKKSLETGFINGFKDDFKTDKNKESADLVITLLKADISAVPGAVDKNGTEVAWIFQISYKASLQNSKVGKTMVCAGTAQAKSTFGSSASGKGFDANASSAIETMYEQIAAAFFSGK